MAMMVPPILWAGVYLNVQTPAEYFAIGIGLQLQSPALVIITFLGGLAAASGIMIVMTLATAAMFLNHLVLPFHKPSPRHDFYRWLLWMRRALIAGILLLAYFFYAAIGTGLDLNRLGLLAFVASLQFFTRGAGVAVLAALNRKGFSYRSDRRHSGLDLQHAAAVFGLPYGLAITAAVAGGGRNQLASGGHCGLWHQYAAVCAGQSGQPPESLGSVRGAGLFGGYPVASQPAAADCRQLQRCDCGAEQTAGPLCG